MRYSKSIADKLVQDDIIQETDKIVVEFGLRQLFAVLRSLSITFLISFFLNKVLECVIFLLFFWPLRVYAGGYHAKTSQRCLIISVVSIFVILELNDRLILSQHIIFIITLLFALIIYKVIPQENTKKKLDIIEYKVYRKRGKCILVIELAISIVMHIIDYSIVYTHIMYGVDESSCSKIRGEGVFEKVVETVHFLKENGCGEISLSMVICDKNQDLEEEFKKLNIKLGTHPIVRVLSFVGRGKEKRDELSLMSQGEVYIPDKFFDTERPYVFWGNCLEKNRKRMIRANGDIYTCPLIIDEELKENNILRVSDLSEVENGKLYNLKEKLLSQNPKCRTCKVNPFCWNCIATIKENTENGAMDDYCSKVKAFYFNTVWGE